MKTTLLILFLTVASVFAAPDNTLMPPLKAIEQFGSISITDDSSFFTFTKDGSFRSGPLGISGREFEGRWTADNLKFTVTAKLGWMNGSSTGNDYRRIVFVIYHVQKRKPEAKPKPSFGFGPELLYDSYFLIDELVKIPKPKDGNAK